MVRETSQWEREEMEKVVSKKKKNLKKKAFFEGGEANSKRTERISFFFPFFLFIVAQKNAKHISGWRSRDRGSGLLLSE